MEEVNTPRLVAAAKEFNIGTNTLIDFLVSKNFNCDDFKAGTKLSEDMYSMLQVEFKPDKVARQEAEQINLPENAPTNRINEDFKKIQNWTTITHPNPIAINQVHAKNTKKGEPR